MVGLRNRHEREVATLLSQVRGLRERAETAEAHVCDEISRQLHEGIGQELTVVGWELDDIREGSDDSQRVAAAATRLRERIMDSQDALRAWRSTCAEGASIKARRRVRHMLTSNGLGSRRVLVRNSAANNCSRHCRPKGPIALSALSKRPLPTSRSTLRRQSLKSKSAKSTVTGFKLLSPTMEAA